MFQLQVSDEYGKPIVAKNTRPFTFYNLKIKDRKDLTRKDIEYDMLRIFPG